MKLKFAKMHGLGNDFMVIDAINQSFSPRPELIRQWADRHDGIGFDQMLVVSPADSHSAAFKYNIYNADGGEVAQCGNGARCFARFVREQGLTELEVIPVETNTGLLQLEAVDATRYRVNMGIPQFEPDAIPMRADTGRSFTIPILKAPRSVSALSPSATHTWSFQSSMSITPPSRYSDPISSRI